MVAGRVDGRALKEAADPVGFLAVWLDQQRELFREEAGEEPGTLRVTQGLMRHKDAFPEDIEVECISKLEHGQRWPQDFIDFPFGRRSPLLERTEWKGGGDVMGDSFHKLVDAVAKVERDLTPFEMLLVPPDVYDELKRRFEEGVVELGSDGGEERPGMLFWGAEVRRGFPEQDENTVYAIHLLRGGTGPEPVGMVYNVEVT